MTILSFLILGEHFPSESTTRSRASLGIIDPIAVTRIFEEPPAIESIQVQEPVALSDLIFKDLQCPPILM